MRFLLPIAVLALAAAPAFAADIAVTRFHTPASLATAAPGPIAVRAGAGLAPDSLEARVWTDAVAAALVRQGFTVVADAPRVAEVSLEQAVVADSRPRERSGVSVGVGVGSGGGGWYGRRSGVDLGVGVGFRIGGNNGREDVAQASTLGVTIRDGAGAHLWEGRAETTLRTSSRKADPHALASEMAERLFSGFPGESGATIGTR
jgi:hypothetical protein